MLLSVSWPASRENVFMCEGRYTLPVLEKSIVVQCFFQHGPYPVDATRVYGLCSRLTFLTPVNTSRKHG